MTKKIKKNVRFCQFVIFLHIVVFGRNHKVKSTICTDFRAKYELSNFVSEKIKADLTNKVKYSRMDIRRDVLKCLVQLK